MKEEKDERREREEGEEQKIKEEVVDVNEKVEKESKIVKIEGENWQVKDRDGERRKTKEAGEVWKEGREENKMWMSRKEVERKYENGICKWIRRKSKKKRKWEKDINGKKGSKREETVDIEEDRGNRMKRDRSDGWSEQEAGRETRIRKMLEKKNGKTSQMNRKRRECEEKWRRGRKL